MGVFPGCALARENVMFVGGPELPLFDLITQLLKCDDQQTIGAVPQQNG
jgi:hypothetical protein